MTTKTSLFAAAALAFALAGGVGTAEAGRGGSAARIQNAINTGSVDAIIAELERAERLICDACTAPVMGLLDDERYAVREAAAWWIARRPVLKAQLTETSINDLASGDSLAARNAADILGTFRHPQAIGALSDALGRSDLSAEARLHVVRALGTIGHADANPALAVAMGDADAGVRYEALTAWAGIRHQDGAAPAAALVSDPVAKVRARAAAVVGELREPAARAALEAQVVSDPDPVVRRNAAWALGRIGDPASRSVLEQAREDASGLVRMTARTALRQLR